MITLFLYFRSVLIMSIDLETIRQLVEAFGPSGMENEVRNFIIEKISSMGLDAKVDKLGNIIVEIKKDKELPMVILDAHMDEVGFLITHIDKNGFLRFEILGGIDDRILLSQRVVIRTKEGYIYGVIGSKAPHLLTPEEKSKVLHYRSLFIDIGASSREEVEELGVTIGSMGVFDSKFVVQKNRIIGKAFDDRIGCFILLNMIKKADFLPVNLTCIFSIQEEVGLRGARALSMTLNGDYAFALERTAAADTPGVLEHDYSTKLGAGPAITIADKASISHPKLVNFVVRIAREHNIPYQFKGRMVGGTDAAAYQYVRYGIPSITISVPSRYIHSAHSIADIEDIKNATKLLSTVLENLRNGGPIE